MAVLTPDARAAQARHVTPLGTHYLSADLIFRRVVEHVRARLCPNQSAAELSALLCDLRADVDQIVDGEDDGADDGDDRMEAASFLDALADRLDTKTISRADAAKIARRIAARLV
jgi:hypothetical protein